MTLTKLYLTKSDGIHRDTTTTTTATTTTRTAVANLYEIISDRTTVQGGRGSEESRVCDFLNCFSDAKH